MNLLYDIYIYVVCTSPTETTGSSFGKKNFFGLRSRPRPNIPAGRFIGFISAKEAYQFHWILQREDM